MFTSSNENTFCRLQIEPHGFPLVSSWCYAALFYVTSAAQHKLESCSEIRFKNALMQSTQGLNLHPINRAIMKRLAKPQRSKTRSNRLEAVHGGNGLEFKLATAAELLL